MLDSLVDLITGGPLAYLLVLGLVAFDAVIPAFPSETAIIAAGVLSERGDLVLPVVVLAGAAGAIAGDTVLYVAGSKATSPLERWLVRHDRARAAVARMRRALERRTWLLVVLDFVPGGRTAGMFAAGVSKISRRRFYAFIVPGALFWATVYALLGVLGGTIFRDSFWASLAAALALAAVITLVFELLDRTTDLF